MNILGIIPARYASARLPGKALEMIGPKTMIRHVYERCMKAGRLNRLVVATDHPSIVKEVQSFGGEVMLTSVDHPSGTDRCSEVVGRLTDNFDYVLNVQGDEPFIDPAQIDLLAEICQKYPQVATLIRGIDRAEDLFNRNVVKVVISVQEKALYFSRTAIPAHRDLPAEKWIEHYDYWRHIGMYAYRKDILHEITQLPVGGLEKTESLEQLRWLENGYDIRVGKTDHEAIGVDTPDDLERVRTIYHNSNS